MWVIKGKWPATAIDKAVAQRDQSRREDIKKPALRIKPVQA